MTLESSSVCNVSNVRMGDHSLVYYLGMQSATQANSAFYSQQDGK